MNEVVLRLAEAKVKLDWSYDTELLNDDKYRISNGILLVGNTNVNNSKPDIKSATFFHLFIAIFS